MAECLVRGSVFVTVVTCRLIRTRMSANISIPPGSHRGVAMLSGVTDCQTNFVVANERSFRTSSDLGMASFQKGPQWSA